MASERARSLVMEHWIEAWDRSRVVNASPLDSEEVAKHLQKSKKAERALLDYIESLEAERERREELEEWIEASYRLHQEAADALPDSNGDVHRELIEWRQALQGET